MEPIRPIGDRDSEIAPVLRVEPRKDDEREERREEQPKREKREPQQPAIADADGHIDVVA